jgi:riboflavin synthase
MFTGIVQAIGSLKTVERGAVDARFVIDAGALDLSDLREGDSISVSGVCLTALGIGACGFACDVSAETLSRTTLGGLAPGSRVNLEKSLLPTTRLGGHLVSGHVDGVGRVVGMERAGRSRIARFEIPSGLARYVVPKGSICIDGVSLTVNEVAGTTFSVNLIPYTLESTVSGEYTIDRPVNVEVDLIARYLEGLLRERGGISAKSGIDWRFLAEHGFITDA